MKGLSQRESKRVRARESQINTERERKREREREKENKRGREKTYAAIQLFKIFYCKIILGTVFYNTRLRST